MLRQRRLVQCKHVCRSAVRSRRACVKHPHSSSPSTLRSSPSAGLPKQYLYTCVWTNCKMGIRRCSRFGSYSSARREYRPSALTFPPAVWVFRSKIKLNIRCPTSYPKLDNLNVSLHPTDA